MYQEIILDHYRHPHHKGLQEPYDVEVHHVNPTCGDEVTVRVRLGGDGSPVVDEISYDGMGCSISQASTSVMTDLVSGRSLDEALARANDTKFGLTAGLFSREQKEIDAFFDRIEAGVVYVNRAAGATTGAWPGVQPFGGWKGSGSTGKNIGGLYTVPCYMREQSRTVCQ